MRKAYIYVPLLSGLLLAACDDDTTEPNPTLAITVGDAVTLVQGQSGTTTITVTRGGGYSDAVDLTVSNLPVGVTAALDPQQIPAGSGVGTSTLTLTADATATPGTAQFNIEAEATTRAGLVANATSSVTVNEPAGFALAVDPDTVSIGSGSTGTSNVTITRSGGFAEAVNLTVDSLPTGVTASFDNAAPTGDAAVVTFTVDSTVTADTTTVHVKGTGTPGSQTADIVLVLTGPGPAPGFSISLAPDSLTIGNGASDTTRITVNKTGTFAGPVNLSVVTLPAGVTAAFAPAATSDTSVLTLSVDSTAVAGAVALTVRASADGFPDADTTLTLTVGTPAPANGFTLSASADTLNAAVSGTATDTIKVARTGTFTGKVHLTVTGLPTGVTAAFAPDSVADSSSVMTVTLDATAVPGTYPIVVHGTADGQDEKTLDISLVVGAASGVGSRQAFGPVRVGSDALVVSLTQARRSDRLVVVGLSSGSIVPWVARRTEAFATRGG